MDNLFLVKFRTDVCIDFGSSEHGHRHSITSMLVNGTNLEHIVMVARKAGVHGVRVVGVLSPYDVVLKLMGLSFHYSDGTRPSGRYLTTYYLKDEVVIEGEYDEEKHGPIQT